METEKIKTLDDIKEMVAKEMNYRDWDECINDQPNWMVEEVMDKVAEKYASQFKQPPVSVMPKYFKKTLEYMIDSAEPGREGCTYGDTDFDSVSVCEGIRIGLEMALSALSKEAPKEKDGPCNTCGKWFHPCLCERIKSMNNLPNKERETAIEFAEWLSKNEWIKRVRTHPKYVGKYYSYINCEYKNIEELFDLFKQRK